MFLLQVAIIGIFQQFPNSQVYQARLSALIGADQAQQRVNEALVLITLGGNDSVNNYFLSPLSPSRRKFSLQAFSDYLISEYRNILRRLYDLGARRVLVTGTGPLGCVPAELASQGSLNGKCTAEPQQAAAIFNPALVRMVQGLNQELGSDVFIVANAFQMNMDFITDPQRHGFITSKVAFCGQGAYNGLGTCSPLSNLCPDRNVYAFWDPFHPTEHATRLIAQKILTGSTNYMSPMNLSTIMALDSRI